MDNFIRFLSRYATGRNVLILLALYLFFVAHALPHAAQALQEASGQPDYKPLDLHFGFTPDEAWQALEALGPAGRADYRFAETVTDIAYPITYGLFFSLLILFLIGKAGPRLARMRWLAIAPLLGVVFDWQENLGIVQLIDVFPARADGWAQYAGMAGEVKWLFDGIGIAGILIGLVGWVVASIRGGAGKTG